LNLVAAVAVVSLAATPVARAASKWTEIVVAEGAYAQLDDNLSRVGATDDVNVVVLHDPGGGAGLRAYALLKDAVAGHTPGQCCSVTAAMSACCGMKDIPLSTIGIDSGAIDLAKIEKFWAYVRSTFPADHYLLDLKGQPGGATASGIFEASFSVADLAAAVGRFVTARGGKKVEVFGLSFCLSGSTDWSYAFAKVADYFVGPPNWTNSPVSVRWRADRWAQELIRSPQMEGRDLAAKMVDVFTEDKPGCSAGCTNLAQGEPWTCGASDLSQGKAYAGAMRDFVCAYLDKFDRTRDKPVVDAARMKAVPYGATNQADVTVEHYDIKGFAQNLQAAVTDAVVKDRLAKVIAAHEKYVFKYALEPAGFSEFGGASFGMSSYFNTIDGALYSTPAKMGPWMTDSLWKMFIGAVEGVNVTTTVSSLIVDAPATSVPVGGTLDLTARGANSSFPAGMCPVPGVAWQIDKASLASLGGTTGANPAQLTGVAPGEVTVTATSGGKSASMKVTIVGSVTTPDAGVPVDAAPGMDGSAGSGGSPGKGGEAGTGTGGSSGSGGGRGTGGVSGQGTGGRGGARSTGTAGGAGSSAEDGAATGGCACRVHGQTSVAREGLALFGVGLALLLARRRGARRR